MADRRLGDAEAFELIKSALVNISEPTSLDRDRVRGNFYADDAFYMNHEFVRFEIGVRMPIELALRIREALLSG